MGIGIPTKCQELGWTSPAKLGKIEGGSQLFQKVVWQYAEPLKRRYWRERRPHEVLRPTFNSSVNPKRFLSTSKQWLQQSSNRFGQNQHNIVDPIQLCNRTGTHFASTISKQWLHKKINKSMIIRCRNWQKIKSLLTLNNCLNFIPQFKQNFNINRKQEQQ